MLASNGDNFALVPQAQAQDDISSKNIIKSFTQVNQPSKWYNLEIQSVDEELKINERVGHSLIAYEKTKKIYMIGGGNHQGDLNEIWTIDYTSGNNEPLSATLCSSRADFPGRYEFLCSTNGEGQAWIFGGADFKLPRNDVLLFDLETEMITVKNEGETAYLENPNPTIPLPRTQGNNCCFLVLKGEECFAVFAGGQKGETAVPDGNIYLYKIADNQWETVQVKNKTPDPVQGHAMVAIGTKVYVHGGMQQMKLFGELYMIDLSENEPSWVKIEPFGDQPCARAAHGIVAIGNEFIIFGGLGDDGALSDLWKFNAESLQWTNVATGIAGESPLPRFDFAMTHVRIPAPEGAQTQSLLLIHGGMDTQGELFDDYWVYPLSM